MIILTATVLFGCNNLNPAPTEPRYDFPPMPIPDYSYIGTYDSADTAIVESIDFSAKTISLINYSLNKSYTLDYNDATVIADKFDQALSMAQIKTGDIVDVFFMKNSKKLVSMKHTPQAFVFDNISKYSLDSLRNSATVGDENFRLRDSTLISSDGRKIEATDIIARDIVTIRGIDRDIYSIVLERGHGYLRLANDAYALGGWIEIGQNIIQRVTDNMLLTVPEGTFDVQISARGFSTNRRVTIERNRETTIDLGDVVVEKPRQGRVVFTISPATAIVYIDGEETNVNGVVELDFGLYQIICEAPGYDTITQYIKISQDIAGVTITMDAAGTNSNNETENNLSVSDNSLAASNSRIYIDAPTDVEVYQNGVYMGISPVFFNKTPGSHTITLRRDGYITKSYQIHIDNEPTDVTYSFSALERNSLETNNSVSGNN